MPRGSKATYTDKQKRKAAHIEEGYEKRGVSEDEAERRAWATVNRESGGGNKSGGGRGKPRFLIRNGKVDYKTMRSEQITHNDLLSSIRESGCFTPSQVQYAVLETSGKISVKKRES